MKYRNDRRRQALGLESLEGRKAPSSGLGGAMHGLATARHAHVRGLDERPGHDAIGDNARHGGLDDRPGHEAIGDNARHNGLDERPGHDVKMASTARHGGLDERPGHDVGDDLGHRGGGHR